MKRQHPDALLLFRMGDFYETFDADAGIVADVLGIALTSRPQGGDGQRIPLAGIPYHSLERHLDTLVAAGYRVAIVEQTSPPGRGVVERRVVRVVTPGTVDAGGLLTMDAHNWLVAVKHRSPVGRQASRLTRAGDWRRATSPPVSWSARSWQPRSLRGSGRGCCHVKC
jgi:DNA mismatch repair protein MutS